MVSGKGLLSHTLCLPAVSSHGREGKAPLWVLFYKGTNTTHEVLPSWYNHLPKTSPPNTIILGVRFQHINFKRETNIQTIAVPTGILGRIKRNCSMQCKALSIPASWLLTTNRDLQLHLRPTANDMRTALITTELHTGSKTKLSVMSLQIRGTQCDVFADMWSKKLPATLQHSFLFGYWAALVQFVAPL